MQLFFEVTLNFLLVLLLFLMYCIAYNAMCLFPYCVYENLPIINKKWVSAINFDYLFELI